MSQITRCPFCRTSFKVVADQLRISDGWVRCGQCKQVFDASQHLHVLEPAPLLPDLPLEDLRPPPTPGAPPAPQVWSSGRARSAEVAAAEPEVGFEEKRAPEPPTRLIPVPPVGWEVPRPAVPPFLVADEPRSALQAGLPQEPLALPSLRLNEAVLAGSEPENPSAEADPSENAISPDSNKDAPELETETAALTPKDGAEEVPSQPSTPRSEAPEVQRMGEALAEPEFVKAARRNAFWRRPAVRAAMWLAIVALTGLLALQVAVRERDVLAARYPSVQPWLADLCDSFHCKVQAPRRISAVVIDSSSFIKERGDATTYQLQVSLKNTSAAVVAMPALELSLTDAQDQVVLRRVLLPRDVAAPAELVAGGVWSGVLAARVALNASQVAGYRLLAFYP